MPMANRVVSTKAIFSFYIKAINQSIKLIKVNQGNHGQSR